jgi:hypothetical protein
MLTQDFPTWKDFKNFAEQYARDLIGPNQYAFRGQPNDAWGLTSTLDRFRAFHSDKERERCEQVLLQEFSREATVLVDSSSALPAGEGLALLARHHGLPSTWLDWTTSPYIAAYFAFSEANSANRKVAIWVLVRAWLDNELRADDIIEDPDLLRFNRRALRQRGIFVRVPTIQKPFEQLLDKSLVKMTLPASEQSSALADLDEMTINASTLFADFNGVAKTVLGRISGAML